jgi:kynureninase
VNAALIDAARARDDADPLAGFRARFAIPRDADGREKAYFCGNSLGLMPHAVRDAVAAELDAWASHAVEGHFRGEHPWMPYHRFVREPLAAIAGARPDEVVAMNSLTVNLHLLMVGFYRPTRERPAILIERGAFPSDRHAVESQIRFHGFDPAECLIELDADEPGGTISDAAVIDAIARHGPRLALVLMPGVQYRTGQRFDLRAITRAAHAAGAIAGFDLAHAIGNVPVDLHESGADFAVWCSYKYLNAGPGAVAGAFVHERHAHTDRPRFAGWWGHDEATRFRMGPEFVPAPGADGWQLSNPPILALAPLRVSLPIFVEAGLDRLRAKSLALTGFLAEAIERELGEVLSISTPREPERRGCQLSLRVKGPRESGRALFAHLEHAGVVADWREPDVIRVAPTPLYNSFGDCVRLVEAVAEWARGR